jgi:hypothetical protein
VLVADCCAVTHDYKVANLGEFETACEREPVNGRNRWQRAALHDPERLVPEIQEGAEAETVLHQTTDLIQIPSGGKRTTGSTDNHCADCTVSFGGRECAADPDEHVAVDGVHLVGSG